MTPEGPRAKLTRDPLCSYFDECQKPEFIIYFDECPKNEFHLLSCVPTECDSDMYFVFWISKKFRTLLFLCELSRQQRNNIIGIAARYKIFGVKAHKEIIKF